MITLASKPSVEQQIAALNAKLVRYQELSGKTWQEVVKRQGGNLAFALFQRLKDRAPKRGQVRAERLAALRHGEGIKVRDTARKFATANTHATATNIRTKLASHYREKTRKGNLKANARSWWQVAVGRELSIRESASRFLSISAKYPRRLIESGRALTKYGSLLSRSRITVDKTGSKAAFTWDPSAGPQAENAAAGLDKPIGRAVIALALRDTLDNIEVYLVRKMEERQLEAGLQ